SFGVECRFCKRRYHNGLRRSPKTFSEQVLRSIWPTCANGPRACEYLSMTAFLYNKLPIKDGTGRGAFMQNGGCASRGRNSQRARILVTQLLSTVMLLLPLLASGCIIASNPPRKEGQQEVGHYPAPPDGVPRPRVAVA